MTIQDFSSRKNSNQKISMITCYDASFAKIINQTSIDCILIGDSCSMVMHGHSTTIPATVKMMKEHTKAVRKGAPDKFIVCDMPFLSTRKGKNYAIKAAGKLIKAGANAVKIEGVFGQKKIIKKLVQAGIPVMAHLGLTPQFYNAFGGHKAQGKTEEAKIKLKEEALLAQECGCFCVLMECIPESLCKEISSMLKVSTIGIGAGSFTDGQVLVLHDMLGLSGFKPKFVKQYLDGFSLVKNALELYAKEVKENTFPQEENVLIK